MTEIEKKRKPKERSKNKDWEKERRERLNTTFDVLAALLPQYDPSKPFSKIEILQRAIILLEELQKEKKELLAGNNKEILKNHEELESTILTLKRRNEQLREVMRKAELTIPEFNAKNTNIRNFKLVNKVEKISKLRKVKENVASESTPSKTTINHVFRRPRKYSKILTNEQIKRIKTIDLKRKVKKRRLSIGSKNSKDDDKPITPTTIEDSTAVAKTQPPLLCLQIISNSIVVPPSIANNSTVETSTTNLVVASSSVCSSNTATYTTLTTPIMATSVFVPIKPINTTTVYPAIKPKPLIVPGKVEIPALKKNVTAETTTKCKAKLTKKRKKDEASADKSQPKQQLKELKIDTNPILPEPTLPSDELSNDLFANLQVPQNGSNPGSLSPTAAYLMNFPLVSTEVSAKMNEDGNHETGLTTEKTNTSMLLEDNFSTFYNEGLYNMSEIPPLPMPPSIPLPVTSLTSNPFNSLPFVRDSLPSIDVKQRAVSTLNKKMEKRNDNYSIANSSTFTFSLTNTTSSTVTSPLSTNNTFLAIPPPLPTPSFISSKSNLDFLTKPNFPPIKSNMDDDFYTNFNPKSNVNNSCSSSFTFSLTNPTATMTNTTQNNFYYNKNFPFPAITAPPSSSNPTTFNSYSWDPPQVVAATTQAQNSCQLTSFTFSLTSNVSTPPKYACPSAPPPPPVSSSYNTYNPFSTDQYDHHYIEPKTTTMTPIKKSDNPSNQKPSKYYTPVNWMTASQFPPIDFTPPNTTVVSSATVTTSYYPPPIPPPKSDIFFAHPPGDDNFPWSPNKMSNILDSSHLNNFIPATLPTLQGDLALSTPAASCPLPTYEQPKLLSQNNSNNNFFSVNQLIENENQKNYKPKAAVPKESKELVGKSRASNKVMPTIPSATTTVQSSPSSWNFMPTVQESMLTYNDYLPPPQSTVQKHTSTGSCNNYSAESLIGNNQTDHNRKRNDNNSNFVMQTPAEASSYFPPMDLNTESANNYNSFLYSNNYTNTNMHDNSASYYSDNYSIKPTNNFNKYPRPPKNSIKTRNYDSTPASYFPPTQSTTATNSQMHHLPPGGSSLIDDHSSFHHQHVFHAAAPVTSSAYPGGNHMGTNAASSSVGGSSGCGTGGGGNTLANFNLTTICPEISDKVRWG